MRCVNCRAEVSPNEMFCGDCGQPVSATPVSPAYPLAANAVTCPRCDAIVDTGESFCGSCGYGPIAVTPQLQNWTPPPPPNIVKPNISTHLVAAIISILFCWPLAIPAIIFAAQVNGRVAAGDVQGATDASKKARLFSYIGIGAGMILTLIVIVMYAVVFILAIVSSRNQR